VLGEGVDIGAFSYINAAYGVIIDDKVKIGSHVAIHSDNTIDGTHDSVHICKNACIGSHSVIFPGVVVGKNAKVGAHSVVKIDVPDDVTFTNHALVKA